MDLFPAGRFSTVISKCITMVGKNLIWKATGILPEEAGLGSRL
jgi:hypothetical protein